VVSSRVLAIVELLLEKGTELESEDTWYGPDAAELGSTGEGGQNLGDHD
jgi:hypothetical protein